jgi:hypothetical protein
VEVRLEYIQVTKTEVWRYEPDYDSEFYTENNVDNIKACMDIDKRDVESGAITIDEIGDDPPTVTYEWRIIDGS